VQKWYQNFSFIFWGQSQLTKGFFFDFLNSELTFITKLFRQKASISVSSWLMVCTRPGTMVPPDSINIIDAQHLGIGLLK
jgi:hypothetical protein